MKFGVPTADANFDSKNGHVTNCRNFAHSKRRMTAILKIVFLSISQRLIVRLTRNLVQRSTITSDTGHVTKIPNFENSRWRTAAILKMVYRNILAGNHPISMKFGVGTQIRRTVTWQSIETLQIQNGWRPPYWKSLLAIYQRFIVRLTRNLVRRSRITLRHRSDCQNTRPSFCLWVIMSASLVRAHIFHVDCFTRIRQRYVPNPVEILNLVRHMYVTRTRTLTLS